MNDPVQEAIPVEPTVVWDAGATSGDSAVGMDVRASRIYVLSRGHWVSVFRRSLSIASLVALDVVGLGIGLYIALVLRGLLYGDTLYWNLLWREGAGSWLPFLAPITVLVFLQADLYAVRERRAGFGRVVSSMVLVALIVLAFGLGIDYDFTTTGLIPTAVVTCALAIGLLRTAYESLSLELMRSAGIRRRVILVGRGESIARIHRQLGASRSGIAYELVGIVSHGGPATLPVVAWSFDELPEVLARVRPDELVFTESDFDERTLLRAVELAHRNGIRVRLAPNTTELLVHEGEYVPGQGVPLFELRPPILTGFDFALKRVFDVVVSGLAILTFLPFWCLIALSIKIGSRGPVFYLDRRIGVGEHEFAMLKFRTMVEGAAAMQEELEHRNEASGALFKIRKDPRITAVGGVLRRFSLDELPQLVNVVRGQMSLVGPRPLPLRDHERLEEWHKTRYKVLPGMTGLWQISRDSGLSFDDLVRLDFTYLENWSVWMDVSIIAKTLPAVISRRGAY